MDYTRKVARKVEKADDFRPLTATQTGRRRTEQSGHLARVEAERDCRGAVPLCESRRAAAAPEDGRFFPSDVGNKNGAAAGGPE
ncbi:unnamed protein product [Caenorhabditis auriculariae]|uniref:Uncharacterized protein n=1 Tax=Caenorhabditis auriculariae TaxID=2777116 RepID=A0A8S1HWM7_9PELO|nr:unnamed protein product [Caenorhabditis auriculariae]